MNIQKAKIALLTIVSFTCMFFIISCAKEKLSPPPPPVTPVEPAPVNVATLSPTTGRFATVVTITGSGFSAVAAEDTVKFNGIKASVQQATTTQLTVSVPPLLTDTAKVTVTVGKQTGAGPVFNYIFTYTV